MKRQPEPARRGHDVLIALQSADGAWDLTQELATTVGVTLDSLWPALEGAVGDLALARRALATAVALAWLEKNAPRARVEWEMLAGKARRWLSACAAAPAGGEGWIDLASRLV
jgi:hypothetical protein